MSKSKPADQLLRELAQRDVAKRLADKRAVEAASARQAKVDAASASGQRIKRDPLNRR